MSTETLNTHTGVAGSPKVHYNFELEKNLTYVQESEYEGERH
jgi:hypothetical protein